MDKLQSNRISSVKEAIRSLRIRRLTNIPIGVPHSWEYMYPNQEDDGSFVVVIINDHTEEEYRCYMPVDIVNEKADSTMFVHKGFGEVSFQ